MIDDTKRKRVREGIGDIILRLCEEQILVLSKPELGDELGLMVAERIEQGKPMATKVEEEIIKVVRLAAGSE
jgi:hypothetical protein